jgi:hypothetical protein
MIFEQGNPAGIKQVFDSLGIADSFVRLPLVQVDASLSKRIDQFVKDTNRSVKCHFFAKKYFVVAKLITKFATKLRYNFMECDGSVDQIKKIK